MPQESGRSDGLLRFSSAWKRRNPASADAAQEALSDVPFEHLSQAIRVLPCKSTEPAQKPLPGPGPVLYHNNMHNILMFFQGGTFYEHINCRKKRFENKG